MKNKNLKICVLICSALTTNFISNATAAESMALISPLNYKINTAPKIDVKIDKLSELTQQLRSIGDRANDAATSLQPVSENMATNYPALWNASYQLNAQFVGSFTNCVMDIEPFNVQDWIKGLSAQNASHQPARTTAMLNYTPTDLADNLFIGGRCNGHSDSAGNRYQGTGGCCQHYVKAVRTDLLEIGMIASRHSRAHQQYVTAFNNYEQQLSQLYQRYLLLQSTPGFPAAMLASYPQKPADNYVYFNFRNWLLQLAPSSNNNPAILSLTDTDNAGRLATIVYVMGRHAACGHTTQEHTSHNWCCSHHYTKSLKMDMFTVAQGLATNQGLHETYVTRVSNFETNVKTLLTNYWAVAWNRPINGLGTPLQPNTLWNQDALKNALQALKSAEKCREIANDISEAVSNIMRHESDETQANTETAIRFQWFQSEFKRKFEESEALRAEKKDLNDQITLILQDKTTVENKCREIETKLVTYNTTLEYQTQLIVDKLQDVVRSLDPNETFEAKEQAEKKGGEHLVDIHRALRVLQSKNRLNNRMQEIEDEEKRKKAMELYGANIANAEHIRVMIERIRSVARKNNITLSQDTQDLSIASLRDRLIPFLEDITPNPHQAQSQSYDLENLTNTLDDILIFITDDHDKQGTFQDLSTLRQINASTRQEILRYLNRNHLTINKLNALNEKIAELNTTIAELRVQS